ncbi:hypothetical protein C4564_00245 [Candidatus Microgenomates bacterium]|nr:MAG: hypothetical protein C4564_00245 [Candidatus Microgenomates bacterium]
MRTITIFAENEQAYYRVQALIEQILIDLKVDREFTWIHHDGLYLDTRGGARAVVFNAADVTEEQLITLSESVGAIIWKRGSGLRYYVGDIYT